MALVVVGESSSPPFSLTIGRWRRVPRCPCWNACGLDQLDLCSSRWCQSVEANASGAFQLGFRGFRLGDPAWDTWPSLDSEPTWSSPTFGGHPERASCPISSRRRSGRGYGRACARGIRSGNRRRTGSSSWAIRFGGSSGSYLEDEVRLKRCF